MCGAARNPVCSWSTCRTNVPSSLRLVAWCLLQEMVRCRLSYHMQSHMLGLISLVPWNPGHWGIQQLLGCCLSPLLLIPAFVLGSPSPGSPSPRCCPQHPNASLLHVYPGIPSKEFMTDPIKDWCLDLGPNPGIWIITDTAWCAGKGLPAGLECVKMIAADFND